MLISSLGWKVMGIMLPTQIHQSWLYEASSHFLILDFLCDFTLHFDQCSRTTCTNMLAND